MLETDLQQPVDTLGIRIVEEWSGTVPGLLYQWGIYVPPGSADMGPWLVLVGRYRGSHAELWDVSDWIQLVETQDGAFVLRPYARSVCRELIEYVGPRARDKPRPRVYWYEWPLDSIAGLSPTALEKLEDKHISGPQFSWPDTITTRWELWAFELGRAAKYECSVQDHYAHLGVVDSVSGGGFGFLPF